MPKKTKKDNNYKVVPELTPIKNSEKDISKIKVQKKEKFKKKKNPSKIMNIMFIIAMIIVILNAIDYVSVKKYNKGPYFAIPLKTYDDGGTKVYYGMFYKVIDYNQVIGRRDKEIGLWNMPYYTEPFDVTDSDLAITFEDNPKDSLKNFYKKFLRVSSKVKSVDPDRNVMTLEYTDDGDKYTLDIECIMAEKKNELSKYEKGTKVVIIGTLTGFKAHSESVPNTIIMNNVFSEAQK